MTLPALSLGLEAPLLVPLTALLPLTSILLVAQANPYQTLVLRGILGAVAALVYALLGAADVALTEALVGTLLSTTLYAVALRSSMMLRLAAASAPVPEAVLVDLRQWIDPLHLRLELLPPASADLHALLEAGPAAGQFTLRLSSPQLLERLALLPGAEAWRAAGHRLERAVASQERRP